MSKFVNSDEKAYKSMNFVGVVNIIMGIVIIDYMWSIYYSWWWKTVKG